MDGQTCPQPRTSFTFTFTSFMAINFMIMISASRVGRFRFAEGEHRGPKVRETQLKHIGIRVRTGLLGEKTKLNPASLRLSILTEGNGPGIRMWGRGARHKEEKWLSSHHQSFLIDLSLMSRWREWFPGAALYM